MSLSFFLCLSSIHDEYCNMFVPPTLCCRLLRTRDVLVLEVARLRLEEAVAALERNNPASSDLPALRQCLKELVERFNVPFLPLPSPPH
jgi:hypothetical protein